MQASTGLTGFDPATSSPGEALSLSIVNFISGLRSCCGSIPLIDFISFFRSTTINRDCRLGSREKPATHWPIVLDDPILESP